MSYRRDLRSVLARVIGGPSLITPTYVGMPLDVTSDGVSAELDCLANLRAFAEANEDAAQEATKRYRQEAAMAYGYSYVETSEKPFLFLDGFAVIPVQGLLINRYSGSWSYCTGYNFIRSQLAAALADPDVKVIAYDVNSFGGQAAGCFELAQEIQASRAVKPSIAVVDSACCSAAYALACGASRVIATPTSVSGSIGVLCMHADLSGMLDQIGIKVTYIYKGAHKIDTNPYEPLSAGVKADVQADVDMLYGLFVGIVAQGRGLTAEAVVSTEARIYRAGDAISQGLIDGVYNPSLSLADSYAALVAADQERLDNPDEDDEMTEDEARAAGMTAERARISAIMTHANAAGRSTLAQHMAFNTGLDVEAVVGILGAAPKDAAPAPAVAPATPTGTTPVAVSPVTPPRAVDVHPDPLTVAMQNSGGGAAVGPDGLVPGAPGALSKAAQILLDAEKFAGGSATGRKARPSAAHVQRAGM
jgi:signal peptide peptidase SppA